MHRLQKISNLIKQLHEEFPEAVVVDRDFLIDCHKVQTECYASMVNSSMLNKDINLVDFIAYILPPGLYGNGPDYCCNGLYYGPGGLYTSFPRLEYSSINIYRRVTV